MNSVVDQIRQLGFRTLGGIERLGQFLFFTGQLTTPGPGVPPSLISGAAVGQEAHGYLVKQALAVD